MQKSCRSRQEFFNEYLFFGVDTAENEPSKVSSFISTEFQVSFPIWFHVDIPPSKVLLDIKLFMAVQDAVKKMDALIIKGGVAVKRARTTSEATVEPTRSS